jgi:hypothetical protein
MNGGMAVVGAVFHTKRIVPDKLGSSPRMIVSVCEGGGRALLWSGA